MAESGIAIKEVDPFMAFLDALKPSDLWQERFFFLVFF